MIFRTLPEPKLSRQFAGTVQPQETVLVIDASYSMEESDYRPTRLCAAKESGIAFVRQRLDISSKDQIGITAYGDRAVRLCDLVPLKTDIKKILQAIQNIEIEGSTAIGAGLREAERILNPGFSTKSLRNWFLGIEPSPTTSACQRVILLSDGGQNSGIHPLPVAKRLLQADVQIDCIGIGGSPQDVDEDLLRKLASLDPTTGKPRYRFIKDKDELTDHFRQLATNITR